MFKILFGCLECNITYPPSEKAVDFVLDLRGPNGNFKDNMCINWNCIWGLRYLDQMLNRQYKHDETVEPTRQSNCLIEQYRRPDGGFSFYDNRSNGVHHSVIIGEEKTSATPWGR